MTRRAADKHGRTAWATSTLAALVLVATGVIAGVLLVPESTPASLLPPATAEASLPVTTQELDDARQVAVTARLTEETTLMLGDSGRLRRSVCKPGATITSGSSPATVDDRPVLALATDVPLWRDLAPEMTGDDVASLQRELARLGFEVRPDGEYGAATKAAVTALQKDALDLARAPGTLAVASVLWLPAPSVTVTACAVQVGGSVGDTELATVAGTLESLRITTVPQDAVAGDRIVRLPGSEVTAPVGGDGAITDRAFLDAVRDTPAFRFSQSEESTEPLSLDYLLATPLEVSAVPPGSLYALSDGTGCVVADGTPRTVSVVSSSLGQTFVTFDDGSAPARVALTPPTDDRDCG
ncbi:peptidoglycan hydrolase-like protein with peptidoglycan-binding domain [Cellulosimicrobium cellulans]|uniref:peptidoglycan-binding domain-containing protein n=1 Tax=Cellulosimicrobium cellulans TaxID=1710 RepID=UPI00195C2AE7|nr:peptidoglycan-binding domain-containing protein [Cellulosimicrobium cellulans]MBM7820431.1 peptidoglycan hydrolase-like protein with peptidoglycan-binding domain [Cellulosimicrobium cellulans]